MSKTLFLILTVLLTGCTAGGTLHRPIADDLNSERANGFLNPEIQMFFGKSEISGKNLGTYTANKRTNGSNKTPEDACQIAFLSAIKSLQNRAVKQGGNAVTNIHSYYKNVPQWSDTTYRCEDGHIVTAVTLRGTVIKM
ncbi:MAG: excinuclease ABC subunit A [Alphaproteobacteria bacterium]|nr:excinuclease ABC subunit A [Alphaproteobacteria bacterium]